MRWQHPTRGLLGPGRLHPARRAHRRRRRPHPLGRRPRARPVPHWRDRGIDLPVAVNLAAANIVDVTLPDAIGALLERHGVPADRLECEISEHTVMADPVRATAVLGGLRELGVGLSLDDFGTGHSSLVLPQAAAARRGQDRPLVRGRHGRRRERRGDRALDDRPRAQPRPARRGRGRRDRARSWTRCAELRCDTAQGYHISRPLPADELDLQALSVSLRGPARKPRSSSALS